MEVGRSSGFSIYFEVEKKQAMFIHIDKQIYSSHCKLVLIHTFKGFVFNYSLSIRIYTWAGQVLRGLHMQGSEGRECLSLRVAVTEPKPFNKRSLTATTREAHASQWRPKCSQTCYKRFKRNIHSGVVSLHFKDSTQMTYPKDSHTHPNSMYTVS